MTDDGFGAAFDEEVGRIEAGDEAFQLREALRQANDRLKRAKVTSETVAEAALRGAEAAVLALGRPRVKPYTSTTGKGRQGRAEAALWHLTDWQGAKKTTSYDSGVMRERAKRFVRKAAKITEIQRADHPVKVCHILLGGDMIEGLFNFPTQPYEIDMTLFDQFVNVASLLDEVVRQACQMYDEVVVHPEWGNHGRLGSKRDAVPRNDNADRMTYKLAAAMGKDVSNLTWLECPEDIQRVEIGNYRALLLHGDEVGRNGFASPTTILQHVNRWKSGAYPWDFRDVYIGHYHSHLELPMANGEGHVYQTGSMESDNRYARETMAASAVPSQRLHFIDLREGSVTAQYQLYLDKE
jgi:hypothetical protein